MHKQPRRSGETIFTIIGLWGHFRHKRAVNSVIGGLTWSKLELNLDIMHVHVTYKSKIDLIISNREKVVTSNCRCSMAANSIVSDNFYYKVLASERW